MTRQIQQQTKRRSRSEWERLVAEWKRSGATPREFAARRGLVASTFRWWASRLGRGARAVQLVPVRVVDQAEDALAQGDGGQPIGWTLRTPRGELRVHGGEAASALLAVARALLGAQS